MSSSSDVGTLTPTEYDAVFSESNGSFPIFKDQDGREFIFCNTRNPFTPTLLGELAGVRRIKVQR